MRLSLLILVLAGPAWGQSVKLPAEVKGDPGAFVRVAAETDCASLQWYALDPGLNLFPVELLKDTKTAVVTASAKGRYRLLAYGAKGDKASEPAVTTVVVGDAPVPPPGPDPPPAPVDPLTAKLSPAYHADVDPAKATHKTSLAAVYTRAAALASDGTLDTWGKLFARMKTEAQSLGVVGKLPAVQGMIATELTAVLPTDPTRPLDAAGRELATKTFNRIASALAAIQ